MVLTGDEALIGRVLNDRYLIGRRIARGGMASVFWATDQRLDRPVAIKVMHHGLGDDRQFTERFHREAKSAAKLNHPNVVSVFDQGVDGEVTYLVMEYVPGRTLRDIMREEAPMPPYRALELLEQILIALSAAHGAHIIHRDVKPENVLITPSGEVKVADFGLARAVSAATTATGGTLIGTVSYLAPEIVVNEGADARSDVYACGAMLYEMLTGVKPHSGESPIQVAYKHVHEDIGKPSDLQHEIPPYVDALVARATVRDRDQRSTDARVMLQQLRSVQRSLNAGMTDDPELVADLLPGARITDADGEPTEFVKRGAVSRTAGDDEATQAVRTPSEPTVQWDRKSDEPVQPLKSGLLPPVSSDDYKQMRMEEPRSNRGRNLLVLAIVLTLLAALLGWYIGVGRYDKTPQLVGSAEAAAKQAAERNGFEFKVAGVKFSEKYASGVVMSTDPGPGKKILPGATITAIVSKGPDRVRLPANLQGMTLAEATSALSAIDLKVGNTVPNFDEKVPKDRVIGAVGVAASEDLRRGTTIDLSISKGKKPIDVVDYTGKPAVDAEKALEKAGFKVKTVGVFSDTVAKGIVMEQTPHDGTKFKGDTITLTVSKGVDLVVVPNMVGKPRAFAGHELRALGFKVQAFGGSNKVVTQTPSGGTLPRGATITLICN
ncbi:Stk1 family PASTA domain-containing Ser/Thr kinase [Aeromicrobium panaciterrae]|uniref:Stk1 family PASTA domain-containing Ser/Thr kinase n=1 Tax=Aeromicrobium panaciterrae TaxID=363861 RepID=UPI0031E280FB